jgi:hypothetical protein
MDFALQTVGLLGKAEVLSNPFALIFLAKLMINDLRSQEVS